MTVVKFILLVALSVLIIILGMPNIEQSRQEARITQAYILAQQIKAEELPRNTVDPWGNRFDIQHTSTDAMVVSSRGANMFTPASGYDSDDISTAMSEPPHKRTMTQNCIQIVATLALSASPWFVALALLRRGRIARPQQSNDQTSARLK